MHISSPVPAPSPDFFPIFPWIWSAFICMIRLSKANEIIC